MTRFIRSLLEGIGSVMQLSPDGEYRRPRRGDTARDAMAMRRDFGRVALDLRAGLGRHGKQVNNR